MANHATPEAQPDLTAEQLLLRVQTAAIVHALGRKKAEAFLRFMADRLANAVESNVAPLHRSRPLASKAAAVAALSDFRAELSELVSVMADKGR